MGGFPVPFQKVNGYLVLYPFHINMYKAVHFKKINPRYLLINDMEFKKLLFQEKMVPITFLINGYISKSKKSKLQKNHS